MGKGVMEQNQEQAQQPDIIWQNLRVLHKLQNKRRHLSSHERQPKEWGCTHPPKLSDLSILPTPRTNLVPVARSPAPCWGWRILLLHFLFSRSSAQQLWAKSVPKLTHYWCTAAVTIPDSEERSFKSLPLCEVTSELLFLKFGGPVVGCCGQQCIK